MGRKSPLACTCERGFKRYMPLEKGFYWCARFYGKEKIVLNKIDLLYKIKG
jgi:hypothetical protein